MDGKQKMLWKGFFLFTLILFGMESYGQATLVVENVQTQHFPELRFEVRSSENLVAGKSSLVVKDNYVAVPRFKITAGKKAETGTAFAISYTVLDPDRLDGTTTFEYRGQSVTTTYLVKKASEKQEQAYPKEEHSDNRIFYIIGGLGLVAGVAGFLLARRKSNAKQVAAPAPPPVVRAAAPVPNEPLLPVMPPLPPQPSFPPQPAVLQPPAAPSYEDAYKPPPQQSFPTPPPAYAPPPPAFVLPPVAAETLVSPDLRPTLELRLGDHRRVTLTLTGMRQMIGRAPECDLLVLHPTVSKVHAAVLFQNGTWWIEDLGSTNGTYVDGQRVSRTALRSGSKLHFGQVGGVFQMPDGDYRQGKSERNVDR